MMPASSTKSTHVGAVSSRDRCSDPRNSDPDIATHGWCSHCRTEGEVRRYRLRHVGLRYLDPECAERLTAMGMRVDLVAEHEPRKHRRFQALRRRPERPARFPFPADRTPWVGGGRWWPA